MNAGPNSLAAGLTCFTLSLAINTAVFHSFGGALKPGEKGEKPSFLRAMPVEKKTDDSMNFQFVEAPPQLHAEKPKKSRRIAAYDAFNQDLAEKKPLTDGAPQIPNIGPSEQLAQAPAKPVSQPAPALEAKSSHSEARSAEESPQEDPSSAKEHGGLRMTDESTSLEQATEPQAEQKPSPASQPSQASPEPSGRDKILTPETTQVESKGAKLRGITSFEATGSGMGVYMKNLKEKIWMVWFPSIAFKYPTEFRASDVVVSFVLDKQGTVNDLKIAQDGGNPVFAAYCADAVERAANFGPLPQEITALLGKEELEISFAFHMKTGMQGASSAIFRRQPPAAEDEPRVFVRRKPRRFGRD